MFTRKKPLYTDRNEKFESVMIAARLLNLTRGWIYKAICEERIAAGRRWAYVGNPLPALPKELVAVKDVQSGETWPTLEQCSEDLQMHHATMLRWIKCGKRIAGRKLVIGPDYAKGTRHWKGGRPC